MPEYRRLHVPGGCIFFTVAVADRNSSLLTDHIELLRASVARGHYPPDWSKDITGHDFGERLIPK